MDDIEYIRDPILDTVDMRKMFVGGITFETTDEEFKDFFERQSGGKVVDFYVMRRNTEKKSYFGFVTFEHSEQLDDVLLKREALYLDNRRLEVHRAMPKKADRAPGEKNVRTKKLFIANYPVNGTEEELKNYLNARHPPKYGKITKLVLIHQRDKSGNPTGENKGYGFFEVSNEDLADKVAIQHAIFDFGGRKVEIRKQFEKEKEEKGEDDYYTGDYTGGFREERPYKSNQYNNQQQDCQGCAPMHNHGPPHHGHGGPYYPPPPPHYHHGPPNYGPRHSGPHHGPPMHGSHGHGPPPPHSHGPPPHRHGPPPHRHGPPHNHGPPPHHHGPPPHNHGPALHPPHSHGAPPNAPHNHGPPYNHGPPSHQPHSHGPPSNAPHNHGPPNANHKNNKKTGNAPNHGHNPVSPRGVANGPPQNYGYNAPAQGYGNEPPCACCIGNNANRFAPY